MRFYQAGNLATKSDNLNEVDPGSSKSEEDQTLVDAIYLIALAEVKEQNSTLSKKQSCH
jgi:plasmid segregation protein ParM